MKLVVVEGMDASGKTSSMKQAIKYLPEETVYNKGLRSGNIGGMLSNAFPCSFTLLLELLYEDRFIIRLELRKGKIVLQDRWYYTVLSHNPDNLLDRGLGKLVVPALSKPDLLIYLRVNKKERMERLNKRRKDHKDLFENPNLIDERDERLKSLFDSFRGKKEILDTSGRTEEESGYKLYNLISQNLLRT